MKSIDLVIDLQYGSTGKGLLAGYLASQKGHDTIMTAWGPNAGHTFIDWDNRKFVHTMLANGIVGQGVKRVMVGPGSVLNLDSLHAEIKACEDIFRKRLMTVYIHGHAAVVTEEDRQEEERTMTAIGSTKKGVGAATMNKIRRDPGRKTVAKQFMKDHPIFEEDCVALIETPEEWAAIIDMSNKILVEGAQGFGLSMQHGFYPYTTSRDVTPAQIIADVGMPFALGRAAKVWGTVRTYPIRVANRFDDKGKQVGWSGPHYDDQIEIQWHDIGQPVELTTVTKLPRRLFTYSHQQIAFAADMCDPKAVFLNFCNYLTKKDDFLKIYDSLMRVGIQEIYYGVGSRVTDVIPSMMRGPDADWEMLAGAIRSRYASA